MGVTINKKSTTTEPRLHCFVIVAFPCHSHLHFAFFSFCLWHFLVILTYILHFSMYLWHFLVILTYFLHFCACGIFWSYSLTFAFSMYLWHFLVILTYFLRFSLCLWHFLVILTYICIFLCTCGIFGSFSLTFCIFFVLAAFTGHTHLHFAFFLLSKSY